MAVASETPIERVAQGLHLFLVTGVGSKVEVQPRHLVESDAAINGAAFQVLLHPVAEFCIAPRIAQRLDRDAHKLKANGDFARPFQRVHTDGVPAHLAGQRDAKEVALQAAEGEVFVETERQLHQFLSGGASTPRGHL